MIPFTVAGFRIADVVAEATTAGVLNHRCQLVAHPGFITDISILVEVESGRDAHWSIDLGAVPVEPLELDCENIRAVSDQKDALFLATVLAFLALIALYDLYHVLVQVHGQRTIRKPGLDWDGERLVVMTRSP